MHSAHVCFRNSHRPIRSIHDKKGGKEFGLSICKRGVEEHGGTITYESEEGSGTKFHVNLPSVDDEDQKLCAKHK